MLKGVIAGLIPQEAVEIKQGFLNTKARKMQDKLDYPGVKAVPIADTTFRT